MGKFLEGERIRQAGFKANSSDFSDQARFEGCYNGKPRPFCLPLDLAGQNLFPEIRESALAFFSEHGIHWHDGKNGNPSNHLCDSQVCCVNFLFPFADKPAALAQVLRPVFPEIKVMLPVESGKHVSFEWIGAENYLGEKVPRSGRRARGANCTSADAVVLFEREDNRRQAVIIEWKYTESYGGNFLKFSKHGTNRMDIYRRLFESEDCPIQKDALPDFDALFYEPFYQLMRQQFLAHEMEKAHELGADIVSVLHIAPAHNTDFQKITSPALEKTGETATGAWKKLARPGDRFTSIHTEDLFGASSLQHLPEIKPWLDYIQARYPWVCERSYNYREY